MTQTDTPLVTRPAGRGRWNATDLGLIGVFAALVAGSALVPGIPAGGLGVPITLQTLAVMLTGLVLGPGRAFAAVGLYVLLGLAGLPIFSGGRSGLGILAGPSAGYILAFPLAAAAVGWLTSPTTRETSSRTSWPSPLPCPCTRRSLTCWSGGSGQAARQRVDEQDRP